MREPITAGSDHSSSGTARTWRAAVLALVALCGGGLACAAPVGDRDSVAIDASGLFAKQGKGIDPDTHPGKALYAAHCAGCHNGTLPKAPARDVLKMMAPDGIVKALTDGRTEWVGLA